MSYEWTEDNRLWKSFPNDNFRGYAGYGYGYQGTTNNDTCYDSGDDMYSYDMDDMSLASYD